MGRRKRRDDDWIWPVAQLAALVIVFGGLLPQAKQLVNGLVFMAVCVLGASLIGVVGYGFYRRSKLPKSDLSTGDLFLPSATAPATLELEAPGPDHSGKNKDAPSTTEDFLKQLRTIDWFQFEKVVALVYRKLGNTVTRRGGANPDGGIDLIVEKDGARSAVQCKQWKTWNVGVKPVREFLGAMLDAGCQKGIFVTLGGYTGEAKALADQLDPAPFQNMSI